MKRLLLFWLSVSLLSDVSAQNLSLPSPVLEPVPGTYSSTVALNIQAPAGATLRYRFLESASAQTFPWSQPLALEAMPGESRIYSLRLTTDFPTGESMTKDYIYKISPPAPPVPVIRPAPGYFTAGVNVQASLPVGWTVMLSGLAVKFPLLLDCPTGDKKGFPLVALGPHGALLSWDYTVDKRDQEAISLEVLSPVPGHWGNAQPLVVGFKGIDEVFWSYGKHFDRATSTIYRCPLVLDKTGDQSVTVVGRSRKDGHWIEKSVSWTNGSGSTPTEGWPSSGVVGSSFDLPGLPGWMVSWDEGKSWRGQLQALHEDSSSTATKVLAVQLKKEDAISRYVYWIDSRPPQTPELEFVGGWNPVVAFSGSVEALHRVTWVRSDQTELTEAVLLWGPTGFWKVPDQVVGARVEVQAVNGLWGPPATMSFARTGWSTPEWDPKGVSSDEGMPLGLRVLPRPGFWPVYEMGTGLTVPEPGPQSALLDGPFVPEAPSGTDRTFSVRFAWRDASGLVGPATKVLSVRVNSESPIAAEPVTVVHSLPVDVTSDLPLFSYHTEAFVVPPASAGGPVRYSLSSDGSLPPLPTADSPSVPSSGLRLEGKTGQSLLYRLRWRSFSASGTPGQGTDAYNVVIDRTPPPVPPQIAGQGPFEAQPLPVPTGLPLTGVSPTPVSLSIQWPLGTLRYEVREGLGSVRAVTPESPVWDKALVLDSGVGLDRSYVVSLRGFSSSGHPLTPESRYSVRIDREVPTAPTINLMADPRRPEVVIKNATLGQNPEEVLNYRWSWDSFPAGEGSVEWTPLTADSVRFVAPNGALTHLRVQAVLRDEAGNQSDMVEQTLIVDQNVVYAAPQGTGNGTRDLPLGSITQAVDKMRREGKEILFLGAGSFPFGKTLDFEGFQVFGGWDETNWEKTVKPGRSVLETSVPFTGTSMLESGDRDWGLTRVDLTASVGSLARLAIVRGSQVALQDSSWSVLGCDSGWDQVGGVLRGTNVEIAYAAMSKGSLFLLQSANISFRGLHVTETLNSDGILMDFQKCEVLFQNLTIDSQRGSGFEGVWTAIDSRLTVDGARISTGNGSDRVSAFSLKDSDVTFWNSDISLSGQLSNSGFQTVGGRLELQKTNISLLQGKEFNQGLVVDHGVAILRTVNLKVSSGAYQGGFTVDGGTLDIASGNVELAGSGKRVWGAQFQGTCTVKFEDLFWKLLEKTPGELWHLDSPWTPSSTVIRTVTTGW